MDFIYIIYDAVYHTISNRHPCLRQIRTARRHRNRRKPSERFLLLNVSHTCPLFSFVRNLFRKLLLSDAVHWKAHKEYTPTAAAARIIAFPIGAYCRCTC